LGLSLGQLSAVAKGKRGGEAAASSGERS
jgi:hypothetical protein